jgi:DNA-binding transcriptional ArsR family regulator/uncharacterized protein YndB with AHSA1/START domain
MDEVFRALADPSRRRLLDSLNERGGQSLRELCAGLDMARQSVSKHLAVLEEAGLVTTVRHGREELHYLNAVPINDLAERWIGRYDRRRVHALADLKRALEDTGMDKPEFIYTTYIRTTPERLWRALIEPEFTLRYWGMEFESDWKPGSPLVWVYKGVRIADPDQVVLEADEDLRATLAAEPRSRATFQLEASGEVVKLTVVHGGFEPGSTLVTMIGEGWPRLLSDLKTFMETGEPLPADAQ